MAVHLNNKEKKYDLLIIGAGTAGMAAALYSTRANIHTALFESELPGGQLLKTAHVDNYLGIKKTTGKKLSQNFFDHIKSLPVHYKNEEIQNVTIQQTKKIIKVKSNKDTYFTKCLIIASGAMTRRLVDTKNEEKYYNKGISYCAICDAVLYRNGIFAVVGGGYSAFEEILYLTNYTTKTIYLIHRKDQFNADESIVNMAKKNKQIKFILNSTIEKFSGKDGKIWSITVKNNKNLKTSIIKVDAVFPCIGYDPIIDFLSSDLKKKLLNKWNYIIINHLTAETSIKGIFACGDVTNNKIKQIATASAEGTIAAQSAIMYLKKTKKEKTL